MQNPALAQLEEHLTVEVTWKSRGPWFKSGKPDFFIIFNTMIIEYKIDNESKADAIADTPDDSMSKLAPPPKYIIIINLLIKYEPACRT